MSQRTFRDFEALEVEVDIEVDVEKLSNMKKKQVELERNFHQMKSKYFLLQKQNL